MTLNDGKPETRLSSRAVVLDKAAASAVTEEALKAAYDEKYAKAVPAKEYDASHILVKTEEEAKAIKAELDKGGDFAAIAKEKSTDKGTAANGGSLGLVRRWHDGQAVRRRRGCN
jgi:peptidyl-prolyl cis-trans isomerase C